MIIIHFKQTILVIPKEVGYVYITKKLYLLKFWKSHSCPSVLYVKCQSKTKEVYLLLYIVLWARVITVYKLSKNLKNYFPVSLKKELIYFNVRSTTWWSGDITTTEGTNIEALSSYHGPEQVINEPTHILPNLAFCIDLIFSDKPNLIMESGVLLSLHAKCHHQIVYSKLNLNVFYLSPYQHLIWDYKKANADSIRKSLNSVNRGFVLSIKMFINKFNI